MSDFFKAEIVGATELEQALMHLSRSMGKNVLRRAARAGMRIVLNEVKSIAETRVGRRTGRFHKSFRMATNVSRSQRGAARRNREFADVQMFVGSTAPHAHLIEFGTRRRWNKNRAYRGQMRRHDVLTTAYRRTEQRMFQTFTGQLGEELIRAAKTVSRRMQSGKLTSADRAALLGRQGR
jgi:HK97 gp10 family phage protein